MFSGSLVTIYMSKLTYYMKNCLLNLFETMWIEKPILQIPYVFWLLLISRNMDYLVYTIERVFKCLQSRGWVFYEFNIPINIYKIK